MPHFFCHNIGKIAAANDVASQAVKDGYAGLKALVLKRFAGKSAAETALAEYEKDEETWKKPLQKALIDVGADCDESILQQAQLVLKQVNSQQTYQDIYRINIDDAKGNAIGPNARVENTWNA